MKKKKVTLLPLIFNKAFFMANTTRDYRICFNGKIKCDWSECQLAMQNSGWRFSVKPEGLELAVWKSVVTFGFLLFVFWNNFRFHYSLAIRFWTGDAFRNTMLVRMIVGAIKHPNAPQQNKWSLSEFILRGAVRRCCGNWMATAGWERSGVYAVESNTASV